MKTQKRPWKWVAIVAVVGALSGAGFGAWRAVGAWTQPAAKAPRFETVDRGTVEVTVTETGTMEPLKKVEVKSKVAGRVEKLLVEEGDFVRAGQLLAEIDPTEIDSQVEQIRAQLDGAQARYEQAKRGVTFQVSQTDTGIQQFAQALYSAEARLRVAEEQARAEPELASSEIAQADASLKTAQSSATLLKEVTQPQAVVQARSDYQDALTQEQTATRNLLRLRKLRARGFTPEQQVDTAAAQLVSARARCEQAKARLDRIESQLALEVQDAEARIREATAGLERARANQSRVSIRAREVEAARAAVEQARAQLAAARAGTTQDRMREDDVASAHAAVKQLEQQLREVEVRQRDTRLIASMDGVVSRRYIEQDELITSGVSSFSSGTPVLQIADLSVMLVRMTVNEVDVHKVRVGLPVEVRIDGVRGALFRGRVVQVAPAALGSGADAAAAGQQQGGGSNSVIRFAVKVQIDRPDPRLKPGMTGRCTIVIDRVKEVLRVPEACVPRIGDRPTVTVVRETRKDGKKSYAEESRKVRVGLRGESHVEILDGLEPGDRVKPLPFTGARRKGLDID
ncbi:MAG: HlyD family efflux transporter periplasmic adaptor subunit [Armatimonadota bacterium]